MKTVGILLGICSLVHCGLVRAPSLDTAVVRSNRIGDSFSYSTVQSRSYIPFYSQQIIASPALSSPIYSQFFTQPSWISQLIQTPIQVPVQSPIQIPGQVPIQIPGQVPIQIPGQVPVQIPGQIPGQFPVQIPGQGPVQIPGQGPVQIPGQAPVQIPGQVPGQVQVPGQPPLITPTPVAGTPVDDDTVAVEAAI